MTKNEILIKIVSGADGGGVRSAELGFISEIKRHGVSVLVVVLGPGETGQEYAAASDHAVFLDLDIRGFSGSIPARVASVVRNAFYSLEKCAELQNSVHAAVGNRDVLAVAFIRPPFLLSGGRLGRSLRVPTLWHMPATVSGVLARTYYRFVMSAWGVHAIGNSRHTIESLGLAGGDVVYPGFWPSRVETGLSKVKARNRFSLPIESPVFSFAARLTWDKAPDLVLKAFLRSEAFRAGAHFVLAGGPLDTDLGRELVELASVEGEGRVQILGKIDDVGTLYAASDVFVNGRRNPEPFGISIAEAMASGLPVIAYKAGGPSEMIQNRSTGWLLNDPTVDAYLAGFDQAWDHRAHWQEMGGAARESAMAFSVEKQVENYLSILDRVRRSRGFGNTYRPEQ